MMGLKQKKLKKKAQSQENVIMEKGQKKDTWNMVKHLAESVSVRLHVHTAHRFVCFKLSHLFVCVCVIFLGCAKCIHTKKSAKMLSKHWKNRCFMCGKSYVYRLQFVAKKK